jgi:hypothetical protein
MGQDLTFTLRSKVVNISPEVETFLGAGVTEAASPGHSNLEANFMLLEDSRGRQLLFVSIDTLYAGPVLTDVLKSAVNHLLPPSAVVVAASHTHNSPMLDSTKPRLGAVTQEHFDRICVELISSVREVFKVPPAQVKIHAKQFHVEATVSMRRTLIPIVVSWQSLSMFKVHMFPNKRKIKGLKSEVVEFISNNGSVVGCIWIMPCHPVAYPQPHQLSANYVGEVRSEFRRIHAENKNLPFCFIQGASGDVRPPSLEQKAKVELGSTFTKLILRQPIFSKGYSNFSERGYKLWVRDLMTDFFLAEPSSTWRAAPTGALYSDMISLPLEEVYEYSGHPKRAITCQLVELSGLRIVLISAEPTVVVARKLQRLASNISVAGCVGDTFGYLTSPTQEILGGYEVAGFQEAFSIRRKSTGLRRLPLFFELRVFWKFVRTTAELWNDQRTANE